MDAMQAERREEEVARRLMTDALGVRVERNDDNSADRMFDFSFTMPDGRLGAAEMTAITDPLAREWSALGRRPMTVSGSRWTWVVRRNRQTVSLKLLEQHLPRIAALAERANETDPHFLAHHDAHKDDPSVQWLLASKIRVRGLRESSHPGKLYLESDTAGSFIAGSTDPALCWLEQKLCDSVFDGKSRSSPSPAVPNNTSCCGSTSALASRTSTGSR